MQYRRRFRLFVTAVTGGGHSSTDAKSCGCTTTGHYWRQTLQLTHGRAHVCQHKLQGFFLSTPVRVKSCASDGQSGSPTRTCGRGPGDLAETHNGCHQRTPTRTYGRGDLAETHNGCHQRTPTRTYGRGDFVETHNECHQRTPTRTYGTGPGDFAETHNECHQRTPTRTYGTGPGVFVFILRSSIAYATV